MRWRTPICLALTTILVACSAQPQGHEHYALMPESSLPKMMHQCSRKTPPASGAWTPSDEQLEQLESHLPQISELAIRQGLPAQTGDAKASFRQYQGIIVDGRKLIYINALRWDDPTRSGKFNVHREPLIVCDGGERFWGAIYDPQSQAFSQLQDNGRCCGLTVPPPPDRPLVPKLR